MTPTKLPGFEIRQAAEKDIPIVLQFIRDLAAYEKLSHEAVATESDLKNTLFGPKPYAEVVIGYYEDHPVSFALFFHNYSTFLGKPGIYLEDLFVNPDVRGKGIGKIMLAYLAQLAKDRNCGRLEWWVLDWNKSAINFYKSLGAKAMDEWTVFRVTGNDLDDLAGKF